MNAIASNGDVEILFYEEQEVPDLKLTSYPTWNPTYISNSGTFTTTTGGVGTPIGNNFYTTSVNYSSTNVGDINLTNSFNIRSSKYLSKFDQQPRSRSLAKKSKSSVPYVPNEKYFVSCICILKCSTRAYNL
jgi:hypothetical protein